MTTETVWRHPQTGEIIPQTANDLGPENTTKPKKAAAAKVLPQPVEGEKTEDVVGELDVKFTSLNGPAPLPVTVTLVNAADLVGGTIHWGDGAADVTLKLADAEAHTHTYKNVGDCTLKVVGTFKDGTTAEVEKLVKIKASKASA